MLIAQITDPHIRLPGQKAYGIVQTDAFLPPALAAAQAMRPRPDCVVLSGDLTDFARPAEYAHLRDLLQALDIPCYLMPGNHDDREQLRAAFPDHGYLRDGREFIQYAIEEHAVRILALDTVVPGEGHGVLCAARLQWLAARLAEQPDRPTLVAMHHPPFATGIAHMDNIGLREGAAELEALLRAHGNVERVICGHLHRSIFRRFGGTVVSTCPSTAHQIVLDLRPDAPAAFTLEPPGFHVHAWIDGALVTHVAAIGDYPGPHAFWEEDGS